MRRFLILILILMAMPGAARAADSTFLLNDQCVQCHLLSEQTGQPNSVTAWKQSLHFRPDAGCADCHGGDKFIRMDFRKGHIGLPDRAGIIDMCGKCHEEEHEQFLGKMNAMPAGCTVTCTDCHGYHLVRPSGSGLINPVNCGGCHSSDQSRAMATSVATVLAGALETVENRAHALAAVAEDHRQKGIPVDTAVRKLEKAQKDLSRAVHSLGFESLREYIHGQADEDLKAIEKHLRGFSPGKWRMTGILATGFLVIAFGLAVGYQRAGKKR